ncbi:MAG: stage 0 sporulation family protein [Dehalococcoidales bacterium]
MDENEELSAEITGDDSADKDSNSEQKEIAAETREDIPQEPAEEQPEQNETLTVDVVGVRFKKAGKVYSFDPSGFELKLGDNVIVETARGMEVGQVARTVVKAFDNMITKPLKSVVRMATEEDLISAAKLEEKEDEALMECGEIVKRMNLPMKLISAEYNLEGNHLTIFFGSEGRVDFRELVRELSHKLKTRVEMRQVGPRDEAKLIGGYGRCGRPLCCATFLNEFNPVSIKMAKEQNLPLNPMKISGTCGRLLCCLGYEFEQYRDMKKELPRNGENIQTQMGNALVNTVVVGSNPIKGTVLLETETGARIEKTLKELQTEKEAKEVKETPKEQDQRRRRRKQNKPKS